MKINVDCVFFVLENYENENKRKNDEKKFKILVNKDKSLINVVYDGKKDIKQCIKDKLTKLSGTSLFHLEQVYTLGELKYNKNQINVIYLAISNREYLNISKDACLVNFDINPLKDITFDNNVISYKTKINKKDIANEYVHEFKTNDICLEKKILEILISYKEIISKVDYTDIIYKFLPRYFSLEDVRIVYEKIKNVKVDKSNFRKKIMKYCKETNKVLGGKGYRPTKLYEFKLLNDDIWI